MNSRVFLTFDRWVIARSSSQWTRFTHADIPRATITPRDRAREKKLIARVATRPAKCIHDARIGARTLFVTMWRWTARDHSHLSLARSLTNLRSASSHTTRSQTATDCRRRIPASRQQALSVCRRARASGETHAARLVPFAIRRKPKPPCCGMVVGRGVEVLPQETAHRKRRVFRTTAAVRRWCRRWPARPTTDARCVWTAPVSVCQRFRRTAVGRTRPETWPLRRTDE